VEQRKFEIRSSLRSRCSGKARVAGDFQRGHTKKTAQRNFFGAIYRHGRAENELTLSCLSGGTMNFLADETGIVRAFLEKLDKWQRKHEAS
jgi:hypothetical protein